MAFDNIFSGPPSGNVAAGGSAQAPSFGVDTTNLLLYVAAGNGWEQVQVPGYVPIVQGADNQTDSIAPTELSYTLPATTLYQVTFYYGPSGTSGSGTWTPTVTWTDPTNNNLSLGSPYLGPATAGNPDNLQSYSIPFYCKGGTTIVVSGAYSGTPFPMNIAIRVVAMPSTTLP
jgi:hypothetical protein